MSSSENMIHIHREFSGILFDLHKHGNAILNSLIEFKTKKAIRTEPLKSVFKTIHDTCDYTPDGLICDVKHRLDGLLFFQAQNEDPGMLQSIYYGRSEWLDRYGDQPPHVIFDKDAVLTEPDVAYLCSYCRTYKDRIKYILDRVVLMSVNGPLYAFRPVQKALQRVIDEQQHIVDKLMTILTHHIAADGE